MKTTKLFGVFVTSSLVLSLLLCGFVEVLTATDSCQKTEVIQPFNGKNFDGWTFRDKQGPKESNLWMIGKAKIDLKVPTQFEVSKTTGDNAEMVNTGAWLHTDGDLSVDVFTDQEFGDCTVDLEFMIPKNSNSGVYLMGRYEVQVREDFGKKDMMFQDIGAIYKVSPPSVNASREFGKWQHYVVEFEAPRFNTEGVKVRNARFVKVTLNDKVIQENVWVPGPTGGQLFEEEAPTGPLMFQGNHGPVVYRNIKITVPQK